MVSECEGKELATELLQNLTQLRLRSFLRDVRKDTQYGAVLWSTEASDHLLNV